MHTVALAMLVLTLSVERVNDGADTQTDQGRDGQVIVVPVELASDVIKMTTRRFKMPLNVTEPTKVESVKLLVSTDSGKTWKLEKEYQPTDPFVMFSAPRDGHYWFALQVVYKNGKSEPATVDLLEAQQKVYVDTEYKVLKPR
jgi:hypothetical protein